MVFFRRKQQLVICVVAVVLVADFVWFGCLPLCKTMSAIEQTKATLRLTIAKGTAWSRQLPVLTDQLEKLQTVASDYEARVPTQRALGVFLQQIANLMSEHNLRQQVVVPGKETKAGTLTCMLVSIQCQGKLAQVFEFYKQLQSLDRLIRIEQIKLVNDDDFSGEITMETNAVIYYRPELEPDKKV